MRDAPSSPGSDGRPGDLPDDDRTVIRPADAAAPASWQGPPVLPVPPSANTPPVLEHGDGSTLPVGTRLDEFELVGVVGVGGFGIVYLAQDHSLERRVALKEYMPSALAARRGDGPAVVVRSERQRDTFEAGLKSFINEARLLARFDHPSLVKVYRFWEANGTAYMVMPYYQGPTLRDHLQALGGPPDEAWLRALLVPLTEALEVLHAESCYHRDIAPDNILLLAGSGRPLLLDFGAARRVIGDMTQALTVILKPGYAPLEQYAETAQMRQGPWTDVYALGAVVHFAITGRTPPVSVGRIVSDSYEPLARHPAAQGGRYGPGFLAAIDHALQVKPDQRTPSVAALRDELGLQAAAAADAVRPAATAAVAAAAPVATVTAPAAPSAGRGGLLWGLGLAAVVLAGMAGYLLLAPAAKPVAPAGAAGAGPAVVATAPPAAPSATRPAPTPPAATPPAATPPAVTPQAPAAAAMPFSIGQEFARLQQSQAAGYNLDVSVPKTQLRVGRDQLRFTVHSALDGHVYVLVLGPDGSLVLLLPNTGAPDLRVRAGQPLRLPPDSSRIDATEPLGQEEFLVLVSAAPRSFDHLGGKRQDGFVVFPAESRLAQLAAGHTGPAPLLAGQPQKCSGDACNSYGAARFTVDVVR